VGEVVEAELKYGNGDTYKVPLASGHETAEGVQAHALGGR
jgi:hypothetical protein